jgi:hypothetical protein
MPIYNDNRKLLSSPQIRELITKRFAEMIEESGTNFDIIAGTTDHGGRMRTIPNSTTVLICEQCGIVDSAVGSIRWYYDEKGRLYQLCEQCFKQFKTEINSAYIPKA